VASGVSNMNVVFTILIHAQIRNRSSAMII